MRLIPLCISLLLFACSSERVLTPREYLDERTAATITVAKDPWIFTRVAANGTERRYRDFLHLYVIDVNRMGDHKQYIGALQSSSASAAGEGAELPTLQLETGSWSVSLPASTTRGEDIGIVQPVAESYTPGARWWYFPVDKQVLATIANTTALDAELVWHADRVAYTLWRDGRDALSELTAVLP